MFNTTKIQNYDLEIASKKRYEGKINQLESELRASCTPDQLERTQAIIEKFQRSLVFKYITAENSLVNAVVWKVDHLYGSIQISFILNDRPITISMPDMDIGIRMCNSAPSVMSLIKRKLCDAVAEKLMPHIVEEVINTSLEHTKRAKR